MITYCMLECIWLKKTTLNQSKLPSQQTRDIEPMLGQCCINVGPMLVHRLRRWPNIGPTLAQCNVFAGIHAQQIQDVEPMLC